AAEPRSVDFGSQLFGLCEPVTVEVDPLFEVDVEEVIGHRPPSRGPTADAIVKTAFEVGAVLVEMNEFRVALLHPANVNALRGDFKLARKPDAQYGPSLYSLRIHCHPRKAYPRSIFYFPYYVRHLSLSLMEDSGNHLFIFFCPTFSCW